jgi:hypothetical protein
LTGADWPTAAIDGDVGAVPEGTTWIDKLTLRLPTYARLGNKSANMKSSLLIILRARRKVNVMSELDRLIESRDANLPSPVVLRTALEFND